MTTDPANLAISLLHALEGIEAHCRVETGARGQDHADEGRRIRAECQRIIAEARTALGIPADAPLRQFEFSPTPLTPGAAA